MPIKKETLQGIKKYLPFGQHVLEAEEALERARSAPSTPTPGPTGLKPHDEKLPEGFGTPAFVPGKNAPPPSSPPPPGKNELPATTGKQRTTYRK